MGLLEALGLAQAARASRATPPAAATTATAPATATTATASTTPAATSTASPAGTAAPAAPGARAARPAGAPTIGTRGSTPPAAPDPRQVAFDAAHADVDRLAAALAAHPQRAQVQAQLTTAQAQVRAADAHAAAGRWPQATQALTDARQRYERAQAAADLWTDYQARRNGIRGAVLTLQGYWDAAAVAPQAALTTAQAQATATPPNLAGAIRTLTTAAQGVHRDLKSSVDRLRADLARVTGGAAAAVQNFASAEIAQAQTLLAGADAGLAAGDWGRVAQALMVLTFSVPALQRFATRRGAYETERTPIATQLTQLKAQPALAARLGALDTLLGQADAQAGHETMQFERGSALLKDLKARCDAWQAIAAQVADHDQQRPLAEQAIAALDAHAAAEAIASDRVAVRNLLQQADTAARAGSAAVDPRPDWRQALALVVRARADLQTAQARAAGMGPVLQARQAADRPADTAALQRTVADLGRAYDATAAAPQAAASATLVQQGRTQLAEATRLLTARNGAQAARAVRQAADLLDQARTRQAQQAQAEAQVPALRTRLTALQASPRAAAIRPRIDALVTALAGIDAALAGHDAAAAVAAIAEGGNVATAAETADTAREQYDRAIAPVRTQVGAIANRDDKRRLQGVLAAVEAHADALRFTEAETARKRLVVDIDKAALERETRKRPPVPADMRAIAGRMAANGGGADVDAMIQDPTLTNPDVLQAMASGRFGVEIVSAAPNTPDRAARRTENIKALAATFALVPDHVAAHGSNRRIDAMHSRTRGSGAWNADATIELTGRPNLSPQNYGNALQSDDGTGTGATTPQLPTNLDPDCQPVAGAQGDYLSFTALHEVGHGVDDSLTYMARNGVRPDHGGWKEYGSGLQEVADAVGPHIASQVAGSNFYTTPEQRQYVIDTLMTRSAQRPAGIAAGSAEERAYDAFDRWYGVATSDDIWQRNSDAMSIAIGGRIYHEAYKRNWVSYLADARSKGLTGYQFRAPAEWFAELYAGFHSGALGPNHPARAWLATL